MPLGTQSIRSKLGGILADQPGTIEILLKSALQHVQKGNCTVQNTRAALSAPRSSPSNAKGAYKGIALDSEAGSSLRVHLESPLMSATIAL